jgi:hypothetical protein
MDARTAELAKLEAAANHIRRTQPSIEADFNATLDLSKDPEKFQLFAAAMRRFNKKYAAYIQAQDQGFSTLLAQLLKKQIISMQKNTRKQMENQFDTFLSTSAQLHQTFQTKKQQREANAKASLTRQYPDLEKEVKLLLSHCSDTITRNEDHDCFEDTINNFCMTHQHIIYNDDLEFMNEFTDFLNHMMNEIWSSNKIAMEQCSKLMWDSLNSFAQEQSKLQQTPIQAATVSTCPSTSTEESLQYQPYPRLRA